MESTEAIICRIIAEHFEKRPHTATSIKPETHLFDDLEADDMDVIELMLEMEIEFDIDFGDFATPTTVGALITAVNAATAARGIA